MIDLSERERDSGHPAPYPTGEMTVQIGSHTDLSSPRLEHYAITRNSSVY